MAEKKRNYLIDKVYASTMRPATVDKTRMNSGLTDRLVMPRTNDGDSGYTGTTGLSDAYYSSPSQSSSEYDDELATLARQGNYKAYFNRAAQLANVYAMGQKYYGNSLRQQGLASQGEGTTAGVQLSNAYLNSVANAQSDYYNGEQSITSDAYTRKQSKDSASLQNWSSLLSASAQNGTIGETYDQILADNPDMTDEQKKQLSEMYSAYSNANSEQAANSSLLQSYVTDHLNSQGVSNADQWYDKYIKASKQYSELTDDQKAVLDQWFQMQKSNYGSDSSFQSYLDSFAQENQGGVESLDQLKNYKDPRTGQALTDEVAYLQTMTDYVTSNNPSKPVIFQISNYDRAKNNYGIGEYSYIAYDPGTKRYYVLKYPGAWNEYGYARYVVDGKGSVKAYSGS